jgi:hypothetical protein
MFRRYWRDPGFWRWWWRNRVSQGARRGAGLVGVVLLLIGGWFAADRLTLAGADTGTDAYVLETTVERVVTVREEGKLVRKRVPVVKRVLVRAPNGSQQTRYQTQLVTVGGETRVVRQPVVRYVRRVQDHLVTVNGRTSTISETRLVPTTTVRTRTQTAVVTAERTVTDTQTRTDERTVTDTETRFRTITDTRTETAPPQTVTATVTSTETLPAVTVVVTVTVPRK